jgi:hypothetical protein
VRGALTFEAFWQEKVLGQLNTLFSESEGVSGTDTNACDDGGGGGGGGGGRAEAGDQGRECDWRELRLLEREREREREKDREKDKEAGSEAGEEAGSAAGEEDSIARWNMLWCEAVGVWLCAIATP